MDFAVELVSRVPLFHTGNAPALAGGTADRSNPMFVAHLAFDIVCNGCQPGKLRH